MIGPKVTLFAMYYHNCECTTIISQYITLGNECTIITNKSMSTLTTKCTIINSECTTISIKYTADALLLNVLSLIVNVLP